MQSLSEVDTTSKRASKAAGFSWGISEEIGKAIRSLELFGLPGVINLNLYLKKVKKKHPQKIKNNCDLKNLKTYPSGIEYVIVNGVFAVKKGNRTKFDGGQVLRKFN